MAFVLFICLAGHVSAAGSGITYLSPVPGARWVQPQTSIAVRYDLLLPDTDASETLFTVTGSSSGVHSGRAALSDDRQTVVFTPAEPFAAGETVSVALRSPLSVQGDPSPHVFDFSVAPTVIHVDPLAAIRRELDGPQPGTARGAMPGEDDGAVSIAGVADTLPLDFPYVNVQVADQPSSGRVFMSNIGGGAQAASYLMILENSGEPFFYRKVPQRALDFKVQPNGLLTYFETQAASYYALNNFYEIVDSFRCGNGYSTDLHDLRLLVNGHALLMSYDPRVVDMGAIVPGGYPQAVVLGLVIQELDRQKNVVFEWRSWDHFDIQDATHEDLTASTIDYVHGNAVELDADGNILLSSRHMDEITKINRETGDIMWRMGGKHNEFTFINDSIGFSHQHDIRRLPNGNVTLFDNGNFHQPPFSRAVEYHIDEELKTAELVWQYRDTPDLYGFAMGDVQRLDNGNTFIGWGTGSTATEVRSDGSKVFELKLASGVYSYRAFRFSWQPDILYKPTEVPEGYALEQNYPNPFNSTTLITLRLPEAADVSLKVYDALGREVANLFEGRQRPGVYIARFNPTELATGFYFCRFRATITADPGRTFSDIRKIVLAR